MSPSFRELTVSLTTDVFFFSQSGLLLSELTQCTDIQIIYSTPSVSYFHTIKKKHANIYHRKNLRSYYQIFPEVFLLSKEDLESDESFFTYEFLEKNILDINIFVKKKQQQRKC